MSNRDQRVEQTFSLARERYAELGVDVNWALECLASIPISLQCWQGDDVHGFEPMVPSLGGGLAVTGNYPGRARNADELREDLEMALRLIPGRHRVSLHAMYAETGGQFVERNALAPEHFNRWISWARSHRLGLDFNPTFFAHPRAADGFTLASRNPSNRQFWIEHGIVCRAIGSAIGAELGSPCIVNYWIPDGYKDTPIDRKKPRQRLIESLDIIFSDAYDPQTIREAVECKLFGLGSESYVVGSHEFYLGYAIARKKLVCLDAGHFHPTEVLSDKISSVLAWADGLLLHLSRGVRWDSDHVVTMTDELQAIAQELVRGEFLDRVSLGLDYFDASINRVAAWVVGTRCLLRALLLALLEPVDRLRDAEHNGDFTARLVLLEELKAMPCAAVWDYYCLRRGVPVGAAWLDQIKEYERDVLSSR